MEKGRKTMRAKGKGWFLVPKYEVKGSRQYITVGFFYFLNIVIKRIEIRVTPLTTKYGVHQIRLIK